MSRIGSILRGLLPAPNDVGGGTQGGNHVTIEPDAGRQFSAYGSTGTINYQGFLQPSEYVPELRGLDAVLVYERMRRSDPSVRETLWHMFGPVINAVWSIEPPADPTDDEREQAEFVRAALFDWLDQPWTEVLEYVLSYLTFGHSVVEMLFQAVEKPLTVRSPVVGAPDEPDADATPDSVPADTTPTGVGKDGIQAPAMPPDTETEQLPSRMFTTWRKFSPRLPQTLWQWHVDESGDLEKITQTTWVTQSDGTQGYQIVDLPAKNLLVFTHEKWGDEFTGISLLRSAYKPWIMKEMLEKIATIAYERHGVGYLIAYLPREKENDETLRSEVLKMLLELKQDAVAVMPGPKQTSGPGGGSGYLLEILAPSSGIPDFETMLRYYRGEIAGAMLTRFKELGQSGTTGARATADVQSTAWYNALHSIARYIESKFNCAIEDLVDLNYQGVARYPTLKAAGIEARNLLEFAQSMALLVDSKLIAPDEVTRQWSRTMIDAPAEDMQEARARAQYEAAQQQQQMQADVEKATQIEKVKASLAPRGPETTPKDTKRPRTENAK